MTIEYVPYQVRGTILRVWGAETHMRKVKRKAFSLIELLFVIAIISLLAALLFPVFARAREQARRAVCFSNMRQIGMGLELYIQDYDETYPMNRMPDESNPIDGCKSPQNSSWPISSLMNSRLNWRRAIQPYLKSKQIMICPSNPYAVRSPFPKGIPGDETNRFYTPNDYLPLSYAYNGNFFNEGIPPCVYREKLERPRILSEIDSSSGLILLLESRLSFPDIGNWFFSGFPSDPQGSGAYQSHNGGINFLFVDLHAKRLKLAATCIGKMWTGNYPDGSDSCENLDQLSNEYK